MLIVTFTISSCSTIRFGRSTTVTIETEHPGDVVDILVIGPKEAMNIQHVTLPYKYKVKHNNLPQRVDVVSDKYLYDPFTIGAVHKGKFMARFCKITGWTVLGGMSLLGAPLFAVPPFGTIAGIACFTGAAVVGGPLLAIGYTAETDIPDSQFYSTSSTPVDSLNLYQPEGWYVRQKALDDVYTLLSQDNYKLSKAKASFLMETEPTAELFYLRGISSHYLGERKNALKDLKEAMYQLSFEINPGLTDEVSECISAIEQHAATDKERHHQMWAEIVNHRQNQEMSTPSKLSQEDLILLQEWQEYQQFRRYNKKPDGSTYTLSEYQVFKAQAIQSAKENGYDIITEQHKQIEKDKKRREERRSRE